MQKILWKALNHKVFLMKVLSHFLVHVTNFSFLDETIMLYRHVLHNLFLYNCDSYLLITTQITVHDS